MEFIKGEIVRIISDSSAHRFDIGAEVEILYKDGAIYKIKSRLSGRARWANAIDLVSAYYDDNEELYEG